MALGARTCDDVRKLTGIGMGTCQGRTCGRLLTERLIELGQRPSCLRARPPLRPVALEKLQEAGRDLDQPQSTLGAHLLWPDIVQAPHGDRGRAG